MHESEHYAKGYQGVICMKVSMALRYQGGCIHESEYNAKVSRGQHTVVR